jgi:hypothetical protein
MSMMSKLNSMYMTFPYIITAVFHLTWFFAVILHHQPRRINYSIVSLFFLVNLLCKSLLLKILFPGHIVLSPPLPFVVVVDKSIVLVITLLLRQSSFLYLFYEEFNWSGNMSLVTAWYNLMSDSRGISVVGFHAYSADCCCLKVTSLLINVKEQHRFTMLYKNH